MHSSSAAGLVWSSGARIRSVKESSWTTGKTTTFCCPFEEWGLYGGLLVRHSWAVWALNWVWQPLYKTKASDFAFLSRRMFVFWMDFTSFNTPMETSLKEVGFWGCFVFRYFCPSWCFFFFYLQQQTVIIARYMAAYQKAHLTQADSPFHLSTF